MLAIVRASKPTATAAIAVATAAALRKERSTAPPPHPSRNGSIGSRRGLSGNKLGWHDVGGERGLRGEPLAGIEPGHVEPPLAHWEKRAHALLGILVAKCVSSLHRVMNELIYQVLW